MKILLLALSFIYHVNADVVLTVGESAPLSSHGLNVRNSNSKSVKVREFGGRILVTGLKTGVSQVTVGSKSETIRVVEATTKDLFHNLQPLMKYFKGIRLAWRQENLEISGQLLRLSDWLRVNEIAKRAGARYVLSSQVDPEDKNGIQSEITARLVENMLSPVPVSFGSTLAAFVNSEKKTQLPHYKEVLGQLGVVVKDSPETVPIDPVIGVRILVTEMRKSSLTQFGIRYPSAYQATVIPKYAPDQAMAVSLEALESDGHAKILASPHLICKSGEKAEFLAGGEIPIRVAAFKLAQVTWKRYGILLKINPKADVSGRMSLKIETEVSTIDQSQTVDGIPGFLTNRIVTHFDLKESRTIALSGLLKNEQGHSSEGLPLLSKIPILGLLFSSKNYSDRQTELVILVTPKVLQEEELREWN